MGAAASTASLSDSTRAALEALPANVQKELLDAFAAAPAAGGVLPAAASAAQEAAPPPAADKAQEPQLTSIKSVETTEMLPESKWDNIGCTPLKRALQHTVLIAAAWLGALAESGGVLPRCQDVPEEAKVSLSQMEAWDDEFTVGVLVIS
jgi:hypothetical protein